MSSPSLPVPFFICGKRFFRVCGAATLASGIAITVAGGLAAHHSSGYYLGGLYSGIVSIIYATTLFQVDTVYRGFWSMLIFALSNFIICVVALGISGSDLDFLNTLEACGSYGDSLVTTCSVIPSYVDCSGNSDYFTAAYACEVNYAQDNDGTVDDNQCGCVTSSNDDDDGTTCYNYYHMRSCSSLLDDVPPEVSAAVTFLSILLVVSLITIALVLINRLKPELIRSAEEKRAMEELLQPINVQNVPVTSPLAATAVTPGVVVAVSAAPTVVVPVTPTIVSVTSPAPAPAPATGTVVSVQTAPAAGQPSNQV